MVGFKSSFGFPQHEDHEIFAVLHQIAILKTYLCLQMRQNLLLPGLFGLLMFGGWDCDYSLERLSLTLHVHEDMPLKTPRARVHGGWITFGLHEDLWQATIMALDAMVDFIAQEYNMPRQHALGLARLVVDMRIT